MNTRINYLSTYKPDQFGNAHGQNIPNGLPKNTLLEKAPTIEASTMDSGIEGVQKAATDNLINTNANISDPKKKPKSGAGAGLVMAGVGMASGFASDQMTENKQEVGAGILSGAVSGASTGMAAGPLGAVAGAVIGGTVGGIKGKKQQDARIKAEADQKKYDERMKMMRRTAQTQADDIASSMSIMNAKKGGIIRYAPEKEIIEDSPKPVKLKDTPIFKTGGSVEEIKPELLKKVETVIPTPKFRRGGTIETKMSNVIVDGPSHDEENNTGVKGDKGLPVVKDGKKIAEIESLELVMNRNSSAELERLVKEYKKGGDIKIKERIADILEYEFKYNTYDYSNLMD